MFRQLIISSLMLCAVIAALPSRGAALDLSAMGSYWKIEDHDGTWGSGAKVSFSLLSDYVKPTFRAYWFSDLEDRANGKLDIVPVDFGPMIAFNPHGTWNPYITGGSGWVYVHSDRDDSHSNIGYFAGGGLEAKMFKHFGVFTEVLYRFLEVDLDDRLSDDQSQDFNGLSVNIGVLLSF